jgi:heme-degrading monooxygenase HmoA
MFVHLIMHLPKPGREEAIIAVMHRFKTKLAGSPGMEAMHTLRDRERGTLLILSTWDTREHWQAARPDMLEAVMDDPFQEWTDEAMELFRLEEV